MKKLVYILYFIAIIPLIEFAYAIIKGNSMDWMSGIKVIAILFAATYLQQKYVTKNENY